MSVRVTNPGREVERLRRLAEARTRRQVSVARRVALTMERATKQALSAPPGPSGLFGPSGAAGSGGLAVRSGFLRNSVNSGVRMVSSGRRQRLESYTGTPVPWAPIHEHGGTIHGRPLLYIPTMFASKFTHLLRGHAVKRGHSKSTAQLYKSAIFRSRRGSLFVWAIQGRGARLNIKPLALLTPKVEMPKREPFAATFRRIVSDLRAMVIREVTA